MVIFFHEAGWRAWFAPCVNREWCAAQGDACPWPLDLGSADTSGLGRRSESGGGGDEVRRGLADITRAPPALTTNTKPFHAIGERPPRCGVASQTTYYRVTSTGADGVSDGVQSPVSQFTTPASGQQITAYPQPQ